ncbi:MAG TPA: hypothetical protein IAB56_01630 [Candidatus Scybalousia intestinigallinarum]|nr:hypothetical protein [Candidatus Scybalousia intestinigallinarum]
MERLEKLENESIIELANRMLAKRQETGNEVESQIYGIPITTENCQTAEDIEVQLLKARLEIYESNADAAKHNYLMAAFAEQFKKREKGPSSPISVLSTKAETLARAEQEKREKASDEFYHNFMNKNDIDWNNSNEVYGWMNELVEGINNFDATLPLNEIYSEEELKQLQEKYNTKRLSSAQVIVDELKNHGYTGDKIEINNIDDFNRQYIANYINELEEYGMIITEKYVDTLKENAKGAEDEIINVVYRQAQDMLAASQDQNIDYEAFNEQKTAIDEEISEVARRRKEINYVLDVAKVLPSLEIIANATTAIQVSTDIKKEDLEAKLANIEKDFSKTLNGNQEPTTPVSVQPEPGKDTDEYLSYEETYMQHMNEISSKITENVEKLIEAIYQNEIEKANTQISTSSEYDNILKKIKSKAEENRKNIDALPSALKPTIDTSEILKLKPSGQISSNDETWAIQNFYKVNRGEATEADLKKTNELIEKIPDSPYYQPLKDAMEKWEPYYTEKYHPETIAQRLDDAKKPTIDTDAIWSLTQSKNNDELWALQYFYKINRGEASETELKEEQERIEKIQGSPYYQPLKEAMEKWEPYYTEKYHPEIIAQRLDDAKKPTIDTNAILRLKPAGVVDTNDETWAIQNFYKVNRGEATEADLKRTNELIEKIPDSPYYQALKDAMEKWSSYYSQKYNPEKEKANLEQKSDIYNQIIELNKDNKLSDKVAFGSLLAEAKKKNIFTAEELKNFEELLAQENKQQTQEQLRDQAVKKRDNRLKNLETQKSELNKLVKDRASKEEVEAKLREIAQPINAVDQKIKTLETNLNNIKSTDTNLVDKIVAQWRNKAPDYVDKSKITPEAIAARLTETLQNRKHLKESLDPDLELDQKISDFMELYEKVKNKDYPGPKKDDSNGKKQGKQNILKLDDEEVEKLTEPNTKLRGILNSLKKQAKKVLNWIKEHPVKAVALLTTTGLVGLAAVVGIGGALNNTKDETNKEQTGITQEAETTTTQTPTEEAVDNAMQQTVAETPVVDNNNIATQVLADEQARIATGSDAVYKDIHSAATRQNQLYAQSSSVQDIWQNTNVEAGKMYQIEADGSLSEINGADALVQAGNEGKTIVSTWQNEDGTLGRSVITPSEFVQSLENAEENARTR